MNTVQCLEAIGYVVSLSETGIIWTYKGQLPVPDEAKNVIDRLKTHKSEAMEFLRNREPAIPLECLHDYITTHNLKLTGVASCAGGCVTFTVVDA
jgi:hypothetical protein